MVRRTVTDTIVGQLLDVGTDENVHVLKARDYGSRARSTESEYSDYDVMFVYLQDIDEYVVRGSYVDTIEHTVPPEETSLDNEIELHGWNLRKFVGGEDLHGNSGGLLGSDAMALEFVASNRTYYTSPTIDNEWRRLESYIKDTFKPYALIGHHESLARGNYRKYIDDADGTTIDRTTKRYINVLQALLKRRYVERTHDLPPMDALHLVELSRGNVHGDILTTISNMIDRKRAGHGRQVPPEGVRELLNTWIVEELADDIDPELHVDRAPEQPIVHDLTRGVITAAK